MSNSWHVWQKRVRIGETHIGKGVFALRRFRAGQVIGVVQGIVSNDPAYGSRYCMDLGNHRTLEPIAPFRYVNHSCQPSAEIVGLAYGDRPADHANQLLLEALRDIEPGQEITIDYAWRADAAIPCLCGSAKCRGWVVDQEEIVLVGSREIASEVDTRS